MAAHLCTGSLPSAGHGPAITYCEAVDGKLWAGNGTQTSHVAFCPFCGEAGKVKPEVQVGKPEEKRPR